MCEIPVVIVTFDSVIAFFLSYPIRTMRLNEQDSDNSKLLYT
jgi:hypothetical protein